MHVATGLTFNVRYRPQWNSRIVTADGTRAYSQNLQSCRAKLTGSGWSSCGAVQV